MLSCSRRELPYSSCSRVEVADRRRSSEPSRLPPWTLCIALPPEMWVGGGGECLFGPGLYYFTNQPTNQIRGGATTKQWFKTPGYPSGLLRACAARTVCTPVTPTSAPRFSIAGQWENRSKMYRSETNIYYTVLFFVLSCQNVG